MTDLASPAPRGLAAPLAALAAAMVSVQLGASFAKRLFPLVGAEGTVALRVGIGALLLAAVLRPWRVRLTRASLPPLVAYGIVLGLMNLTFYLAIARVPLGLAVAIEFVGPLAVAALASRRAPDLACVALAVAGLSLLLPTGGSLHGLDPVGVGLALAAGVCWGLYILFGQRAGAAHGVLAPALGTAIAALVAVPVGVAHAGVALLSPPVLLAGLFVAVLSSAIPYSLEMVALTRLPTQTFGTLMSAEPAVATLIGLVVLGEALTPLQWLAIAAVMLASAGSAFGAARPAAAALPD